MTLDEPDCPEPVAAPAPSNGPGTPTTTTHNINRHSVPASQPPRPRTDTPLYRPFTTTPEHFATRASCVIVTHADRRRVSHNVPGSKAATTHADCAPRSRISPRPKNNARHTEHRAA